MSARVPGTDERVSHIHIHIHAQQNIDICTQPLVKEALKGRYTGWEDARGEGGGTGRGGGGRAGSAGGEGGAQYFESGTGGSSHMQPRSRGSLRLSPGSPEGSRESPRSSRRFPFAVRLLHTQMKAGFPVFTHTVNTPFKAVSAGSFSCLPKQSSVGSCIQGCL